jgi:hypothetical protein
MNPTVENPTERRLGDRRSDERRDRDRRGGGERRTGARRASARRRDFCPGCFGPLTGIDYCASCRARIVRIRLTRPHRTPTKPPF